MFVFSSRPKNKNYSSSSVQKSSKSTKLDDLEYKLQLYMCKADVKSAYTE